jgi:hypothetical protein
MRPYFKNLTGKSNHAGRDTSRAVRVYSAGNKNDIEGSMTEVYNFKID